MRAFLDTRDYLEVETRFSNLFTWCRRSTNYLLHNNSTRPFTLVLQRAVSQRLIVAASKECIVGQRFRNEGWDRFHNGVHPGGLYVRTKTNTGDDLWR
jgi:lysyl-tRNA synthetase class II